MHWRQDKSTCLISIRQKLDFGALGKHLATPLIRQNNFKRIKTHASRTTQTRSVGNGSLAKLKTFCTSSVVSIYKNRFTCAERWPMEQFLSRSTCQSLCKQASSEFYQAYTDTGVDAIMNADFSTPNNAAARLFSDSFGGFLSRMCTTVHTCKAAAAIEQGGDVAAPLCFRSFFF